MDEHLEKLLSDRNITKVGININNDAKKLARDWNVRLSGHIDLGVYYNKVTNNNTTWGLQSLCNEVLGRHLFKDKMWRRKWHISPLGKDELDYAATDAWIGLVLYEETTKLASKTSRK